MKRQLFLLTAFEIALLLVAAYFEPTYRVRGRLFCEARFEGKPTSYWRAELERWKIENAPYYPLEGSATRIGMHRPVYVRETSYFEELRERWLAANPDDHDDEQLAQRIERLVERLTMRYRGPVILHGSKDAEPVLRELLECGSPKVRRFARIGLGLEIASGGSSQP